ncbi:hypothetical protein H4219_002616 [Mycoemilia scoparia]|uniref:Phospholipid/glycerol acyltransferase domain-containing protein n=1 Tax=Mycoemilia scoparia TaxID=417184 RepID=A0A9W7ZXT6_9FUNG|nr:hypothetical protein H4219_002616 [Mycoemilia scoparia]
MPRTGLNLTQAARFISYILVFLQHMLAINALQLVLYPALSLFGQYAIDLYNKYAKHQFGGAMILNFQIWAPTKLVLYAEEGSDMAKEMLELKAKDVYGDVKGMRWFGDLKDTHSAMVIANHQAYTDWMYLWILAYFEKADYYIKVILKYELRKLPVGMRIFRFIFIKRNWAEDQKIFDDHISIIKDSSLPTLLLIFPEGTTISNKTLKKRSEFAKKMGWKEPTHVLFPRSTGMHYCLDKLKGDLPYIYDITIGYEGLKPGEIPEDKYGLLNTFARSIYPRNVHMYFRRFSTKDIPTNKPEFELWIRDRFYEKDKMLDYFYKNQRFASCVNPKNGLSGSSENMLTDVVDIKIDSRPFEMIFMWIIATLSLRYIVPLILRWTVVPIFYFVF